MNNLKALITTLVLGSSSAAMASPSVSFSGHAQARVTFGATVRNPVRPVRTVVRTPPVRDHRVVIQPGYIQAGYTNLTPYATDAYYTDRYEGRYDDGRFPVYQPAPVMQPTQWTELASEISFMQRSAKMPSDQAVVHVGGDLELIRIEGANGDAAIKSVYVAFADGTARTFTVNKTLRPGEAVTIDIGSRANVKAMRLFSGITYNGEIPLGSFSVMGA